MPRNDERGQYYGVGGLVIIILIVLLILALTGHL